MRYMNPETEIKLAPEVEATEGVEDEGAVTPAMREASLQGAFTAIQAVERKHGHTVWINGEAK